LKIAIFYQEKKGEALGNSPIIVEINRHVTKLEIEVDD
jgi:hypothetical protein